MEANKDGGTSVGFTDGINSNFETDIPFQKTTPESYDGKKSDDLCFDEMGLWAFEHRGNLKCQHEFIVAPIITEFCKYCGKEKAEINFHIPDNLKIINDNNWDEVFKDFKNSFEYKKSLDIKTILDVLVKWLPENYFCPEKKHV